MEEVDGGVLHEPHEYEHEADDQVHVYRLDVGDLGQGLAHVGAYGGYGEHRGYTCEKKNVVLPTQTKILSIILVVFFLIFTLFLSYRCRFCIKLLYRLF